MCAKLSESLMVGSTALWAGKEKKVCRAGCRRARSFGRGRRSQSTRRKVTVLLDARSGCLRSQAPAPKALEPGRLSGCGGARAGLGRAGQGRGCEPGGHRAGHGCMNENWWP